MRLTVQIDFTRSLIVNWGNRCIVLIYFPFRWRWRTSNWRWPIWNSPSRSSCCRTNFKVNLLLFYHSCISLIFFSVIFFQWNLNFQLLYHSCTGEAHISMFSSASNSWFSAGVLQLPSHSLLLWSIPCTGWDLEDVMQAWVQHYQRHVFPSTSQFTA